MFEGVTATLPASDIDRAKAFYKEKLGLEPSEESPDGSVGYELGGTALLLYPSEFAGTNQATAAGLNVADLGSAVSELRGRGVVFEEYDYGEFSTVDGIMIMPDGSQAAWFKDTEGNIIGLAQSA